MIAFILHYRTVFLRVCFAGGSAGEHSIMLGNSVSEVLILTLPPIHSVVE